MQHCHVNMARVRRLALFLTCLLAVVAAYATIAWLGLTLTQQDSSIEPSGNWEPALLPGFLTVVFTIAAWRLWRSSR